MAADDPEVLLDLGMPGSRITVVVGEFWSPLMAHLPGHGWRHARIEVQAAPFSGTINELFEDEDIAEYRTRAAQFASGTAKVTFGGGRIAEIELDRDDNVVEVKVTTSEEDDYIEVRYRVFFDPSPSHGE